MAKLPVKIPLPITGYELIKRKLAFMELFGEEPRIMAEGVFEDSDGGDVWLTCASKPVVLILPEVSKKKKMPLVRVDLGEEGMVDLRLDKVITENGGSILLDSKT